MKWCISTVFNIKQNHSSEVCITSLSELMDTSFSQVYGFCIKCTTWKQSETHLNKQKNDSRYYFLSRIIYAVRYQDAELMAKLEHHPKRVDVVWERMKLKYDFERQHNPVLPSHQQWWFEYKKTHPKFS
uniref:Uncharacterized protein n=1 Tax=Vannella robusta TaxID=1487602 RepID=A0A7S4IPK9_9EUKA|mmetsp:Transcript_64/g.88  ORF Transcript_64/g.88 Transcript_64/m.88 type:complete len:129 (+) Transcript_64:67-453(+)